MSINTIRDFISSHRRGFMVGSVWFAVILLAFGAFALSSKVRSRVYNSAGVFLSSNPSVYEIYLYGGYAIPDMVNVRVGDTIRFVSKDDGFHDIATRRSGARNAEPRITSGEFGAGDSYELQFQNTGTFSLYDRLNLDTNVTVVVEK